MAIPQPAKSALNMVTAGVKAANDAGLLPPGVNIIVSVVNAIIKDCEQVKAHQTGCQELSGKVQDLSQALAEQTERLERTPLRSSVDEVKQQLDDIAQRTRKWASYGKFRAWLHDTDIEKGLNKSIQEVDHLLEQFHLNVDTYVVQAVTAISEAQVHVVNVLTQMVNKPGTMDQLNRQTLQELEPTLYTALDGMETNGREDDITANNQPISRIAFNQIYLRAQDGILEVHRIIDMPPDVKNLNGRVQKARPTPYAGGQVSDIYEGYFLGSEKVAIKSLRTVEVARERETRKFENEIAVWRRLHHPNVLNFLGVCTDLGEKISLVSDWMDGTDLFKYCCNNKTNADRLKLLVDAARGIQYLHGEHIIHGNLKCAKILVYVPTDLERDLNGVVRALISDFQTARIVEGMGDAQHSISLQTSARWLAPEFSTANDAKQSADVYSFAITMWECFTLERPFPDMKREAQIISAVAEGIRPKRPSENNWITNKLWQLMEDGWKAVPEKRPEIDEVLDRLVVCFEERQAFLKQ